MALYRLAEDLGIWDVRGLEQQMEMPQFQEWLIYRTIKLEEERKARAGQGAETNRQRAKEML